MKRRLCHIFLLFAALIVLAPSCRRDRVRVIPRAKLAKIYAEMFMTDQWIQATPKLRTIADTSLVYEPILEAYGYTSEDYQYSVDHYMNDPERFSRILRTTGEILDDRIKELQLKQAELARLEKLKNIADFVFPEMQMFLEDIPEDVIPEDVIEDIPEDVIKEYENSFDKEMRDRIYGKKDKVKGEI